MRTASLFFVFGLTSLILLPKVVPAQSSIDVETLHKADELMAKAEAAQDNRDELVRLVSEFDPLVAAKGLSSPCSKLMDSMQSIVSIESDERSYAGLSDEVKKA